MANLLASIITAFIVSVGVHLYLDRNAPSGQGLPDAEEPPTVRVSYAGIAPRAELRIGVEEGHREEVELRLWQNTTVRDSADMGGASDLPEGLAEAEMGGVDMGMLTGQLGPEAGEQEAIIRLRLTVKDASATDLEIAWKVLSTQIVPHGDDPEWERAVKGLKRLKGTTRITRRGMPIDATITGLRGTDPASQELHTTVRRWMAEPAPVYPEEAVGHAAVWEVTRRMTDGGVQTEQTERAEIRSFSERTGKVEIAARGSAKLLTSVIDLGQGLNAFDPTVDRFSFSGDGSWTAEPLSIMAIGDAGTTGSARLGLALGMGSVGVESTVETELFVSRVP